MASTYTYTAGSGVVTIQQAPHYTAGPNVVALGPGIAPSSVVVTVSPDGHDLILSMGASDAVTILGGNQGRVWSGGLQIDAVTFADGTVWTMSEVKALAETARAGNTVLFGSPYAGGDTFTYTPGAGVVSINAWVQPASLIVEGDYDPDAVKVASPNGQDLVVSLSATDQITLIGGNVSGSSGGVQSVSFAGGRSLTLAQLRAMVASSSVTALTGGNAAAQVFHYAGGAGPATLSGATGQGLLQLGAGIEPSNFSVFSIWGNDSDGADLVLRFSATDSVTIPDGMRPGRGIGAMRFANGYTLSAAQLRAMANTATAANPVLYGISAANTAFGYNPSAGAATINLRSTSPEVDTLTLNGILPQGVQVSAPNGSDLVLSFGAGRSVTIIAGYQMLARGAGVTSVTFADGTVWNGAYLKALVTGAAVAPGAAASAQRQASPVTYYSYDADGQQVASTDADGHTTRQIWNAEGEVEQVIHADGGKITDSYDAFGDKVQTIDAMGNVTEYAYDGLGRQTVMVQGASVGVMENGVLVGATAGVVVESDDGSHTALRNGALLNIVTTYGYDQLGDRIEQQVGAAAPVDAAAFNASDYIGPVTETLDAYDLSGNLITAFAADDNAAAFANPGAVPLTRYGYDDRGKLAAEIDANGNTETWTYDSFGRLDAHVDFGGRQYQYTYDAAGRLMEAWAASTITSGTAGVAADDQTYSYDAAGDLLSLVDQGGGQTAAGPASTETSSYAYDASGRQVWARTVVGGTTVQNQTTSYDELGRVSTVSDYDATTGLPGSGDVPQLAETFSYDAVGNKIEAVVQGADPATLFYAYNDMNELVMADGTVDGNAQNLQNIQTGKPGVAHGHIMTYDLNGNRLTDRFEGVTAVVVTKNSGSGGGGGSSVTDPQWDGGDFTSGGGTGGNTSDANGTVQQHDGLVTESYSYDSLNRLATIGAPEYAIDTSGIGYTTFAVTLDQRSYDAASRVIQSGPDQSTADFNGPGSYKAFIQAFLGKGANADLPGESSYAYAYDDLGRVLTESVTDLGNIGSSYTVSYAAPDGQGDSDGYDKDGNALFYSVRASNGDVTSYATTLSTKTGDGYKAVAVETSGKEGQATTTEAYDGDGRLVALHDGNQSLADRHIYNDTSGVVLETVEGTNADTDPGQSTLSVLHEVVVNGSPIATYGQGVDPNDPTLPVGSGGGVPQPNIIPEDNYDLAYAPVTNDYPAPTTGVYQVQSGDTLESIALAAYGDASLWYLIAEANGLGSDQDLKVGAPLTIPTVVGDIHDNAGTVAPYNPSKVIGPTAPNLPIPAAPSGGQGCGIGEIIMLVVTVVVTIATEGATSEFLIGELGETAGAIAAGALGGIAGSVAGQLTGLALGVQKGFDWESVALGALGGAIGGGLNGVPTPDASSATGFVIKGGLGLAESGLPGVVAGAALTNALTQGVAVVTGLQKSFNWAAVAGAAVGAGIGMELTPNGPTLSQRLIGGTLGGFAGGGLAAALGDRRSQDLANVATDAFGNALGSSLAENDWSGGSSQAASQYTVNSEEAAPTVPLPSVDFAGDGTSAVNFVQPQGNSLQDSNSFWQNFDAQTGSLLQDGKILGDLGSVPPATTSDGIGPIVVTAKPYQSLTPTVANAISLGFLNPDGSAVDPANPYGSRIQNHESPPVQMYFPDVGSDLGTVTYANGYQEPAARPIGNPYWSSVTNEDGSETGLYIPLAEQVHNDKVNALVGGGILLSAATGGLADEAVLAAGGGVLLRSLVAGGTADLTSQGLQIGANHLDPSLGTPNFSGTEFGVALGASLAVPLVGAGYNAIGGIEGLSAAYSPSNISNLLLSDAGTASIDFTTFGASKLFSSSEADATSSVTYAESFGPPAPTATQWRNMPGVATISGELTPASGVWLDAATPTPIPSQVGEALNGQAFNSFDDLRAAIWENIGTSPELNAGFTRQNVAVMQDGFAPFAPPEYLNESGAFGQSFNLHHIEPISSGGSVYDLSNLQIISPLGHYNIHY